MSSPIKRFTVAPDYSAGTRFFWDVSTALKDKGPWTFQVEMAEGPGGPWKAISPLLPQSCSWKDPVVRRAGKDAVLFYRLLLSTAAATYPSAVIEPYGDLGRREFLLARDIMRREYLHSKTLVGVELDLWMVSTWGPPCTVCRDAISDMITNADCPVCFGTGHAVPYNGPYRMWGLFCPTKHVTEMAPDGTGLRQPMREEVRTIGALMAKKNDVIVSVDDDRHHYVDEVESIVELRTIPVVQSCTIREPALTDIVYRLGK